MDTPAFLNAMKTRAMTPTYLGADDTQTAVRREAQRIERMVKELGLDKK
jgi:tripartite-type tricarboxylate transporter receptor subunit TctC